MSKLIIHDKKFNKQWQKTKKICKRKFYFLLREKCQLQIYIHFCCWKVHKHVWINGIIQTHLATYRCIFHFISYNNSASPRKQYWNNLTKKREKHIAVLDLQYIFNLCTAPSSPVPLGNRDNLALDKEKQLLNHGTKVIKKYSHVCAERLV